MKSPAVLQKELFGLLAAEKRRQRRGVQLIASENECPKDVLKLVGSELTNKYAEGYPGKRYYAGAEFVDEIETMAIGLAKEAFGAEHANVQPHSGSTANQAVYAALAQPGDTILALRLDHGGHLTHGHPKTGVASLYRFVHYGVDEKTETIDWNAVKKLAKEHKPKIIVGGFTAYPRAVDFEKMAAVAHENGALAFADISHVAGLVAAGLHPHPFPHCDVVMTTTHKTLNGPRGAIILCKAQFAKAIDAAVFPGLQGGPLMNVIAGKAWALAEALKPSFKAYQKKVIANARALAEGLAAGGLRLVSGGTDTHLILADLRPLGIGGKEAAAKLEAADIYANFNAIPFDPNPPLNPSGIRFGTAWITKKGYDAKKAKKLAEKIIRILKK